LSPLGPRDSSTVNSDSSHALFPGTLNLNCLYSCFLDSLLISLILFAELAVISVSLISEL